MNDKFRTFVETPGHGVFSRCHVVAIYPHGDDGKDKTARSMTVVEIPGMRPELPLAMAQARELRTRVLLLCQTAEQAAEAAAVAVPLLPKHRRVSLEFAQIPN
jgi:hypothetical protein